jgi:PAS domain S-box-containing protein
MVVQNCLAIDPPLTPELFSVFLEHAPVAVAMFDRQMRYLLTSRRWLTGYGLGYQDIIGRSHYEVFSNLPDHWREVYQRCLAGAVERCDKDFFVRPDGGVEWVKWEIHPWQYPTGEIGGLIMFTEFITPVKPTEEALPEPVAEIKKAEGRTIKEEKILHTSMAVALQQLQTEISDSFGDSCASRKRTEEALRASEARFQKLAANMPGAIYQLLLRPDGSMAMVYISSGCRDLYELEPEAIQEDYERLWSLIHPDDLVALQESILVSAETFTPRNHEARIITPSGKLKWIQSVSRPERLEGGEILWDGLLLDITQRKQTEEQLQQYKEHLEELVAERTAELTKANEQLQQEIAERKRTQEALLKSQMRLELLNSIATGMNSGMSVEQVIEHTLKLVSECFKTLRAAYSILDDQGNLTVIHAIEPPGMPPLTGLVVNLSAAPDYVNALYRDKLVVVEDVAQDSRIAPLNAAMLASGICALLDAPLQHSEKLVGLLWLDSPSPRKWSEHEIATLRQIAEYLAIAIKKTRAQQERQEAEEALRESEAKFRRLAKRETILNRLANQIRNSLDLNTIQQTLVEEIRELLQLDRCHIAWYRPLLTPPAWEVVTEAKAPNLPTHVGCYSATEIACLAQKLLRLELIQEDSVETVSDPQRRELLLSLGYKAILALPTQTQTGEVIILSCIHAQTSRQWTDDEVELLQAVMAQLAIAITHAELYEKTRTKAQELEHALGELQSTQTQLIQSEKMSSLGQLVAGIAHEINNPVSFIYGNVGHASDYIKDLLGLLELYRATYPKSTAEIQSYQDEIELDFLLEDLPKLLDSMKVGATRIQEIVRSLRTFSRVDQSERKPVNLHEDLDNTLLILEHRLRATAGHPQIEVVKDYGKLPPVECYAGQINQVFMNLLSNAIDAIQQSDRQASTDNTEEFSLKPEIAIKTRVVDSNRISITITDNGLGIPPDVLPRIFDLFFTTKPIGKGTGLGLAISYQIIVEKHGGSLHCHSVPGKGTEFVIEIPIKQP